MELTPFFDGRSRTPLYVQLYHYIKSEIEKGNFPAGAFLPSIRQVSQHLDISKNTVEGAYQQLLAEGYVESIARVGYKILPIEDTIRSFGEKYYEERKVSDGGFKPDFESRQQHYDFIYGEVDPDHFPIKVWKKYLQESLVEDNDQLFVYGNPLGDVRLRGELSKYLYQSRGVSCSPEQILLTSGTQHAISLLCQLLSLRGSTVAFEEPGYDGVRSVFIHHGFRIRPIPLDEDGISLEHLQGDFAELVYVTPSHQLPYGMILPVQKRLQLLNWAEKNNGYIIEDDYDSEFRYQGKPIPSLKALDKKEKVIYLGTFSKCMLPSIRVSYLVLPPELMELYQRKLHNYNQSTSPMLQRALYLFMKNGDFERHIRRMRKIYHGKRKVLLQAVERYLGDQVEVIGEKSGLHVLLNVPGYDDEKLIERAKAYGVKVYSLSRFWYNKRKDSSSTVMLGFGRISEDDIEEGVRLLAQAWFE